jgi:hypothetical protein
MREILSYVDEPCDRAADPILCLFELQWSARLLLRRCKYDPRELYLSLFFLSYIYIYMPYWMGNSSYYIDWLSC